MMRVAAISAGVMFAGIILADVAKGAEEPAPASLLYMTGDMWRPLGVDAKRGAAARFMSAFCGVPTMSADDLVTCLDDTESGALFERALACTAHPPTQR